VALVSAKPDSDDVGRSPRLAIRRIPGEGRAVTSGPSGTNSQVSRRWRASMA